MERRLRVLRNRKLEVSGKPERKMPSSTMAKLSGGTSVVSSHAAAGGGSGGDKGQILGGFSCFHRSRPLISMASSLCSASSTLCLGMGMTSSFMAWLARGGEGTAVKPRRRWVVSVWALWAIWEGQLFIGKKAKKKCKMRSFFRWGWRKSLVRFKGLMTTDGKWLNLG